MLSKTSPITSRKNVDSSGTLGSSEHTNSPEDECINPRMHDLAKIIPIENSIPNEVTSLINAILKGNYSPTSAIEIFEEIEDTDNILRRNDKAPILILLGTSTSGKTTLTDPIKAAYPKFKDHSGDIIFDRLLADHIKTYFPAEYAILSPIVGHDKIISVCRGDKIQEDFPVSQLSQITLAAQKLMDAWSKAVESPPGFDEVRSMIQKSFWEDNHKKLIFDSLNGSPVIVDAVWIAGLMSLLESFPANNFDANIHLMIVFCPLRELAQRLTMRNTEAERSQQPSNMRVGFPIKQFSDLYKPRVSKEEPLLQVITRKECIDAFRLHADSATYTEENFLKDLGFISPDIDEVEITTRAPYFHSKFNTVTSELIIKSK